MSGNGVNAGVFNSGFLYFYNPYAPGDRPETQTLPVPQCAREEQATAPEAYHRCQVKRRYVLSENKKVKTLEESVNSLTVTDSLGKPNLNNARWFEKYAAWAKTWLVSKDRSTPHFANNLNLHLAEEYINMFYLSENRQYLKLANQRLFENLQNNLIAGRTDVSVSEKTAPSRYPTYSYFETQLLRIQVLSLQGDGTAVSLANQLERELSDPAFLSRQIVSLESTRVTSAKAYLNRLHIFKLFKFLYSPQGAAGFSREEALTMAQESYTWANNQHDRWLVIIPIPWVPIGGLWSDNMSRKDLKYDMITAQLLSAMIYAKSEAGESKEKKIENFTKAIDELKKLLTIPEVSRKYGGFLDIGLIAFGSILKLSMQISRLRGENLAQAADRWSGQTDWQMIGDSAHRDLRESLGLLSTEVTWEGINVYNPANEMLGSVALKLGHEFLVPTDDTPIRSELPIANLSNKEKLATIMSLIDYIDIPDRLRTEIKRNYRLLGGGQ
ncbi:MAG: hypothetical protein PHH14_05750 [Candidatus Margulisbacteria bacterium]|nr:hypothetical protein [Candidatus Margulisiibacteriota bacterium]